MKSVSSTPRTNDSASPAQEAQLPASPAILATVRDHSIGLLRAVTAVMEGYADRPALGERAREPVTDPATGRTDLRLLPHYTTVSYTELWERAGAVAAEWTADAEHPVGEGDFVAIYGFTSVDYTVLDLACLRVGAVSVPLQNSSALGKLKPIVAESEPRVLATSIESIDNAVELALSMPSRPRLVVFDFHPEADEERERFEAARRRLADAGVTALEALSAVVARGRTLPAPVTPEAAEDNPARLLIYTSGSTGAPKGAIYTDRMLQGLWAGWFASKDDASPVTMGYLPMSHIAGRALLYMTLVRGGTTYCTGLSDMSTLFDDMREARPTQLLLVPRICDMLFQEYQSRSARRAGEFSDPDALDKAVKAELREEFVGGRVRDVICGSAPIAAELKRFVESCLELSLRDGFGTTETGPILMDGRVMRPPVIEYKLADVPELGYSTSDVPHPRGELLLRTEMITPGYYKRPDATASVFDADGFYHTGDIMAETGPDQLVYLDRRNNVLKLSQGEFVTVSQLETTFVTSPLIRQIYVYGNSERAHLLAVIVPTEDALAQAGGVEELKPLLAASLQETARQAELEPYEIPRDFLVETEPFSTANGLLSDIRKNLRPSLKDRYGDQLEALYEELASGREEALRALRAAGPDQPVFEAIRAAASVQLGCPASELRPTARFTDLGVDSLSALSFSQLLRDIFAVEVPVGVLLSAGNNLQAVADHIEAARTGAGRPSSASVHGADAAEARADELTLEKFLDVTSLGSARPASGAAPHTVLLTGANGYLGRFMCLDWLERLSATGGRLICVVRGRNDADARRRLDAAFDSGDQQLLATYRELADSHLEVLAADISEERLGLNEDTWNRLAEDVDAVFHPAALVNHVLPYEQLFGPNVVGTAELIRLALTGKVKPFTYLSTVGVAGGLDPARLDESADIREVSTARALTDGYASGYATSKWAGEVLLRRAHEEYGLPVTVLRSDMILAHRRHAGQLNVPDMFTRLLFSILITGIAPASFYRPDADGERARAHYDGLPGDFVAEAVNALGSAGITGYRTYNVVNPHDDGVSLDTFVDWLIAAGHPVSRIADYDEWFARFETALRALPEARRQYSLLPLLHTVRRPDEPLNGSAIPAVLFTEAVRKAGLADEEIPHVEAELIEKYAADLRLLKLI
ncbi:carboxylic acid reductase [Streptomyces sp. NPDC012751]|uniref:carboxylic acid reductase n=1 Tax=Streptomyces sp. NPDC012751 TaxID=3364846 RepID=UPI003690EF15